MIYIRKNETGVVTAATKATPHDVEGWTAIDCKMPIRPKVEGSRDVRLVLCDGRLEWRVEELPPPPPRTFSKLKITLALTKRETWLPVRNYLVESGLYDLYLAAQDFKEDDEHFVKGLAALKAQFGMTDKEVEAILKEGEA